MKDTPIIKYNEFPFELVKDIKPQMRRAGEKGRFLYKNAITAFDIETTYLKEYDRSLMYIWQFQFDEYYTVIGRTWNDFRYFINGMARYLSDDMRLCIFVHNLSFEFHFLRGIYNFQPDEVFAVKPRKILKCTMMNKKIEFRCSYLHSNLSLDNYTKQMRTEHEKLTGRYDYEKLRFPWTEIDPETELPYCVNDVVSLVEAVKIDMTGADDNLYTFPLTSTGYVRRDMKAALNNSKFKMIGNNIKPSYECYTILKEAFRGGDTHANRFYVGQIIRNVHSWDRKSSYPEVICNKKFPMTPWRVQPNATVNDVLSLIFKRKKAVVFRVKIWSLRLKDSTWGFPYLSEHKCRYVYKKVVDNGRIMRAEYLETTLTDIDFKIISEEYLFNSWTVDSVYSSSYDFLPEPIRKTMIEYFTKKEVIGKYDIENFYLYELSKRKLNGGYGLFAMDPLREKIIYDAGDYIVNKGGENDYNELKWLYLSYAWGVYTTAWARWELHQGLWIVGEDGIYVDTDSVKFIGDHLRGFDEYNRFKIAESKEHNSCVEVNGKIVYMGIYDNEGTYDRFATLGAKKYAYELNGELHITIAGVHKEKGALELAENGGLEKFIEHDFKFKKAGGMEARYSDMTAIDTVIDGHQISITPCVSLVPSTYKLSLEGDYERLIAGVEIVQN